jgi:putative methanogenesis marker 16 metalloprotein
MERSLEDINNKISDSTVKVLTIEEFAKLAKTVGIGPEDVDIVTCATKGIMSGTFCVLSFTVEEPKVFKKARKVWLNDVEAVVGPCPNEFLGVVDLIVLGTSHSDVDPKRYGGGHLFRDLVEDKPIRVKVLTAEGKEFERFIHLKDMQYAKMHGTRHAFKNYLAFVNPSNDPLSTIFSVRDFEPEFKSSTFCGCGILNPIENDPSLKTFRKGMSVLINGAKGMVIDTGTRSSKAKANITTVADLKEMDPRLMGGFITSGGPEVVCSVGVAIPVLNEEVFKSLYRKDSDVELYITDVKGRGKMAVTDYGNVWFDNYYVEYDSEACVHCEECQVELECPTQAFKINDGKDESLCFQCGHCVVACTGGAFNCDLGSIEVDGRTVPVVLRQSDRLGARALAQRLKEMILSGDFDLSGDEIKP